MEPFLIRMFRRNQAFYDNRPSGPSGGSRSAAIFLTGIWLSLVLITVGTTLLLLLWNFVPPQWRPPLRGGWLYCALWVPVLFACDRYVEKLVRQFEIIGTTERAAPSRDSQDVLFLLLQWVSMLAMVIGIAAAFDLVR